MTTTGPSKQSPGNSASSNDSGAIELRAVCKRYGTLEAVAPVSLSIKRGETVALLGPSGSGKTTLLTMIAGEVKPTSGEVWLGGAALDGAQPGRALARQVGLVHQQFDLVPHLSALHNVLVGRLGEWGTLRSLVSLVWPQERPTAIAALAKVGIADRADVRAARLSGGEQQRVAIARLLVQDPAILLADEPVASLDPARAEEVLRLLVDIARSSGKTLVASVHLVDLARRYFTRLIGLRNGSIQFDLPAGDVTDATLRDLYDTRGLRGESALS